MQALIELLLWLCFGAFRNAEHREHLDEACNRFKGEPPPML